MHKFKFKYLVLVAMVLAACIKVRREYQFQLPVGANAAERSQQSVFELRNAILASISNESILEILNDFKNEYSNKDIVDAKQPSQPPSDVLGGKLESSIGSVKTNVCIQDIKFKTAGKGPMSFSVDMTTCGFRVTVYGVNAKLRLQAIGDKPVKLTINEFNLKDISGIKSFTVNGELLIDAAGNLQIGKDISIGGLEALGDPKNFDFQAVSQDTQGIAEKLRKTQDEITESMVRGVFSLTQGYIKSAIVESASKSLQKYSEKFNAKQIGLSGKTYRLKFGTNIFDLTGRLMGIFGDQNITVALGLNVNESGSSSDRGICRVESFDNFPDPLASWMRGNPLVKTFDEFMNGATAPSSGKIAKGAVLVPFSVMDFLLWKILGNKGSCGWDLGSSEASQQSIQASYEDQWKLAIETVIEAGNATLEAGTKVSLQIPKIVLTLPESVNQKIQDRLRKDGFLSEGESLVPRVQIKDLKYGLLVFANDLAGDKPLKISVVDEDLYLPRQKIEVEDIAGDIVRTLRKRPDFSGRTLDSKRNEVAQLLLNSVLNTYLARRLRDFSLSIGQLAASDAANLNGVKVTQEGVWVRVKANLQKVPSEKPLALGGVNSNVGEEIRSNMTEIGPGGIAGDFESGDRTMEDMGVPNLLGVSDDTVLDRLRLASSKLGLKCGSSSQVVLPVNEYITGKVLYVNCYSANFSLEHRFHSEIGADGVAAANGGIVYSRSIVQILPKDPGKRSNENVNIGISFDAFLRSLGNPNLESISNGVFNVKWQKGKHRVMASGYCAGSGSDCPPAQRRITIIEQWTQ